MTKTKQQAIEEIGRLVDEFEIKKSDISNLYKTKKQDRYLLIQSIFANLGGIIIFAGICTLVSMVWDEMASFSRVLVTYGAGLIATIIGIAALHDNKFKNSATPLIVVGLLVQTGGIFVFLDEYFDGGDAALGCMLVFGAMFLQILALFSKFKRTVFVFFTVFFGLAFFSSTMTWLDFDEMFQCLIIGASGLMVTIGLAKTKYDAFLPFFYFIFPMILSFGVFDMLEGAFPFDLLLILLASGLIYLAIKVKSRAMFISSVIIMLGSIGYYTAEYFTNFMLWPIALIFMGMIMLGVSGYALKLSQKITD